MTAKGILTDTTLCIGCELCVEACRQEYKLGEDKARRWKMRIDDLSATRYTTIVRRPDSRFVRVQCRHCRKPACVSVCLVGAMQKTPEGPVIYDPNRCIGCRYCMMACPYGIPRYDWDKPVPYVRKCTLCYVRLGQGRKPACVEACPTKATIFGARDDLVAEAHRRIRENPGKYIDKVVGETEIGGTSVIYISDIPLDFLAWRPGLDRTPLPDLTWVALSKVPPMVLGVGGVMAGLWWIIDRRMRLAEHKEPEHKETEHKEPEKKA
jgi:formate dehydrogenase iron-sulfur subunit